MGAFERDFASTCHNERRFPLDFKLTSSQSEIAKICENGIFFNSKLIAKLVEDTYTISFNTTMILHNKHRESCTKKYYEI